MTRPLSLPLFFLLLAPTVALAGDPANLLGEWRGQAQYQATVNREQDPAAHRVTALTIKVEPGWKVWGTSTENGCKLLGLARPMSPTMNLLTLDVTLSGCQYSGLNRRYSGTLAFYSGTRVELALRANTAGLGAKPASFEVSSTMSR